MTTKTRTRNLIHIFVVLALLLSTVGGIGASTGASASATIVHVDANAAAGGNGQSWGTAYNDLQTALTAATSVDQIWVAAGTYKPGASQSDTFMLKDGVRVYGGFAGGETDLSQRNWRGNPTILSGDLLGDDGPSWANRSDNSRHVVTAPSGVTSSAILDGFTISGGYATGNPYPGYSGGGMLSLGLPTLANLTFSGNYASSSGGGLETSGPGSMTLTNVTFSGNSTSMAGEGGGMTSQSGTKLLTNVTFDGNSAVNGGGLEVHSGSVSLTNVVFNGNVAYAPGIGGGMHLRGGSATLTNVIFAANRAQNTGGGLEIYDSANASLDNVTFYGNLAESGSGNGGPAIHCRGTVAITNSIVWNDASSTMSPISTIGSAGTVNVSYSIVQGGYSGTGNSISDPSFVSSTDFHLQAASPAIDAGNNSLVPTGTTTDMEGDPRIVNGTVDMGAYEYSGVPAGNRTPTFTLNKSIVTLPQDFTGTESVTVLSTHPDAGQTVTYSLSPSSVSFANVSVDPLTGEITITPVAGGTGSQTFTVTADDGRASNNTYSQQFTLMVSSVALVIYVDHTATGANDGTSWANAYTSLQQALSAAFAGQVIKVAAGTYTPGGSSSTFTIKNGVAIYGGFPSGGGERDLAGNLTVLSGSNSVSNVVTAPSNTDGTAVLDGFMITGGIGSIPFYRGGGLLVYGSPTLANLIVSNNRANTGAGMYLEGGSPTMTNIVFETNTASLYAGGLAIKNGSPTMADITFRNNKSGAFIYGGGGMHMVGGHATLTNATFSGNSGASGGGVSLTNVVPEDNSVLDTSLTLTNVAFDHSSVASYNGGGMIVSGGSATLTNCDFTDNSAGSSGGGLLVTGGSATVINSIFWGNTATGGSAQIGASGGTLNISYSDIQGGYSGTGNISAFPFVNSGDPENATDIDWDGWDNVVGTWDDGLRLAVGSPAIDAGNTSAVAGVTTDLAGRSRVIGGNVDMGVFESKPALTGVIYVDGSATGNNDGTSWADAFTNLGDALLSSAPGSSTQVWVAAGTYKPAAGTNSNATFLLENGVKIYGGFAGNEASLDGRDPGAHETILSGDLKGDDGANFANRGDNVYHVVSAYSWTDATAVLDGFTISGGNARAAIFGGGIYNKGGNPTFAKLQVSDNSAGQGGGMYTVGGNPALSHVTFAGNTADNDGGGILVDGANAAPFGNPTLTNVTFDGNHAYYGGGMAVGRDVADNPAYNGTLTLSSVNFSGNTAEFAGGLGAQIAGPGTDPYFGPGTGKLTLNGGVFEGNHATAMGGGMYLGDFGQLQTFDGAVTLTGVAFRGNSAGEGTDYATGGGMLVFNYSTPTTANPKLTNVVFSGNRANSEGGGLHLTYTNPALTNVTFAGNASASGGAVLVAGGTPVIKNSVLWGDTGEISISPDVPATPSVSYSIVQGGYSGTGNLNSDPLFVSPVDASSAPTTSGDLHLQGSPVASPAIDAGDNGAIPSGVAADLDGKPRKVDGNGDTTATVDMGAYEFQGTATGAPQITSADSITFTVGTSGTFTVTATGSPTATITETGTLPSGVTFADKGDGTATLSGTPAAASGGVYPVTITAANGISPDVTQAFTLTVYEKPYVTTQPQDVTVATGGTATFTAAAGGYPAPTVQWQSNDGFGWTDIAGATSTTLELQNVGTGINNWQYRAVFTSSQGSVNSNAATLKVTTTNHPPVAQDQNVTATAGVSKTITLGATDADPGDSLTYSIVTTPTHGTLSAVSSNQVTYTAASGYSGADTFTFKANDGKTDSNFATVHITVTAPTTAPEFTSPDSTVFMVGQTGTFAVTATGNPAPTLWVNPAWVPAWLSVVYNADGTVTMSGTPPSGQDWYIDISATNTVNSVIQNFTLHCYQAASITTQPTDQAADVGGTATFTVAASGFPTPSVQWQVSTNGGTTFTNIADEHQTSLTLSSIVQAMNGWKYRAAVTNAVNSLTSDAATLTVTAANHPPVANAQTLSTEANTPLSITLTATDADSGDTLSYQVVTQPSHGTLSGTPPNLTYTPDADFTGDDSFTFKANDGKADSNTATISITVNQVNATPVLSSIDPDTAQAGGVGFALTVNGSGFVSGSVVRWNGVDLTTTFVNSTQLTASVPAANVASASTAEITVFNPTPGGGSSAVTGFFVTPSTTTVASQDTGTGSDPTASTDNVTAAGTGEGTVIVAEYSGNPGGSALSTFTGAYFDVYVSSSSSLTSLTVQACNLNVATTVYWWSGTEWVSVSPQSYESSTGCVKMTLDGSSTPSIGQLSGSIFAGATVNAEPVANPVSATTTQDKPITINLDATDGDGDALTYSIASQPTCGTLSPVSGNQVTYTPDPGYTGSESFTYKANDGQADSNVATVSITVNEQYSPADLSIKLGAAPDPVTAGSKITYTISVANSKSGPAQNVEVTFDLPEGSTFVSAPNVSGWTAETPVVGATGTVTFTKSIMTAREKASLRVVVNVNSDATGTIQASTEVGAASPDPAPTNNTARVLTMVTSTTTVTADVAISQSTATYDPATKKVTWTLQVTNNGPDTAQGLEIKDNLAKGTVVKSVVVPDGATYTVEGNNVLVKLDSLAAGETVTIIIEAEVKKPVGTISNTAVVKTASLDPVDTNNTCTASIRF